MGEFEIKSAAGCVRPENVPIHVRENLAQTAYASILRAWNSPEIRGDYEKWKSEQSAKTATK